MLGRLLPGARAKKRLGRLEGRRGDAITGWAFDPARPGEPVALRLEGSLRTETLIADRHRADVRQAGHGDGHCGFSIPARGWSGKLRVVFADTGADLPGSPLDLDATTPGTRLPGGDTGWVVVLDPPERVGLISGYVVDPAAPFARFLLRNGSTGEPLARACRFRAEALAHRGDGFNGFLARVAPGARFLLEGPDGRKLPFEAPR